MPDLRRRQFITLLPAIGRSGMGNVMVKHFHGFSARPFRGVFSYTRCERIGF